MFYTCLSFCPRGREVAFPACITGHMTRVVCLQGGLHLEDLPSGGLPPRVCLVGGQMPTLDSHICSFLPYLHCMLLVNVKLDIAGHKRITFQGCRFHLFGSFRKVRCRKKTKMGILGFLRCGEFVKKTLYRHSRNRIVEMRPCSHVPIPYYCHWINTYP